MISNPSWQAPARQIEVPGVRARLLRLGIVGAGYVTAQSHLPASREIGQVQVAAIADVRADRARSLAEEYGVPLWTGDYLDLVDQVDAVIVALPHDLHASVSIEFLRHGIHVLCEKPMALSTEECRRMVEAADETNSKLAVGHMRRFYDNMRLAKRLIDTGFLGEVQRFEIEESVPFESFPASPFTIRPPYGGVLWDTGPHDIDLLLWMFGDFSEVRYRDDAMGGVEADCEIEIVTETGLPGAVHLSRICRLANRLRVYCRDGVLTVPTLRPHELVMDSPAFSGPISATGTIPQDDRSPLVTFFAAQLQDFVQSIQEDRQPAVTGLEGSRSIAAIESCRQVRQPMAAKPWMEFRQGKIVAADR